MHRNRDFIASGCRMILRRFSVTILPACALALALQACGGGSSGGGSSGQSNTPGPGTPGTTRTTAATTRTPVPATLTPTATLTPVRPGGNGDDLLVALKSAAPGSTVVVVPGSYPALILHSGDLQGPVTLLADITTSSEVAGAVTINAVDANQRATAAAISLDGVTGLTIDGITAQGGKEESILVLNSPDTVIRNCIDRDSQGDGIFVQSSAGTVLFDNLTYRNTGAGIRVYGSSNVQVVNNTIYGNRGIGLFIGTASDPSSGVVVENNIINTNLGVGIEVESGNDATGDYNLNTDGYAGEASAGAHDIAADPLFVSGATGNFHLEPQLDDCTSGSPAINAGNPETSADFIAILQERTTQEDQKLDCVGSGCCTTLTASPTPGIVDLQPGEVDLGYHYAAPPPTPTPKPRTPAKTKTPTRTPTRTPTL